VALFDVLVELYRDAGGWPVQIAEEDPILSIKYKLGDDEWVFVATVDDDDNIITIFSRVPENCPPARRAAMCEFLVRANYGMTHGAFDMDIEDGEIRYRVGTDLQDMVLTPKHLQSITNYNLATMATFLPAIRAVIAGTTPAAAMEAIGFE
jgi:hypothetical protein